MTILQLNRGDKVILGVAIVFVLALYSIYWQQSRYGNQASVFIHGKFWSSFNLYEDQTITVKGKLGDSVLQIQDGNIRFVSSPCPNKICILHGWAQRGGEFIACVPNEVSVRILGPDSRFDTINF